MAAPEPIFICQWRISVDEIDPISAVRGKAEDARRAGVGWLRVSWHPDDPLHLIMEGWTERPIDPDTGNIDQGEVRWKEEDNG